MAEEFTTFDEYKVTDAGIKWFENGAYVTPSVKLGCTGKLEIETTLKTVIKKCEGDTVRSVDIPTQLKCKFTGHMPVENLRKVWGLKTDGLKKGVYAYGTDSRQGRGIMSFKVLDLDEAMAMLRAFPNMQFSGGMTWELENGGEEIAEIEQEFIAMKDDNNKFFYEALQSEVDTDVADKWLTDFTPDLVKAVAPASSTTTSK